MVAANPDLICPQCGLPECSGPMPLPMGVVNMQLKDFKCRSCGEFRPVGPGWRIQCPECMRHEHRETAALMTFLITASLVAGFLAGWLIRGAGW